MSDKAGTSVTEFLKDQDAGHLVATIERVQGEPGMVKVTPWVPNSGCLCHHSITVAEKSFKSVHPTGQSQYCCGKHLKVVEIQFKDDATMNTAEVFGHVARAASEENATRTAAFEGDISGHSGIQHALATGWGAFCPIHGLIGCYAQNSQAQAAGANHVRIFGPSHICSFSNCNL